MAIRKTAYTGENPRYAICVLHADGSVGWLLDSDAAVKLYDSADAAEKHKKQLMKNRGYLWNEPIEVREFTGFGRGGTA